MRSTRCFLFGVLLMVGSVENLLAENPASTGTAGLIAGFREKWDDSQWEPMSKGKRAGYMRPLNDAGWLHRMALLQGLVQSETNPTGELQKVLKDGSTYERILAAQAIGFVASNNSAREALEHAAEHDPDPAVRLYAADSLGMLGGRDSDELLRRSEGSEKNGDVKRHLRYALEREGQRIDASIVDALKTWDANQINSARLGSVAPNFELVSLTGKHVRLSDFRNQKSVVLVFVYGDT